MGRQRDPKRDKAFEIYKASNGEINLNEIAAQLGVSDGTVRGWKAKDKWENLLTGEVVEEERVDELKGTLHKNKRYVPKKESERTNNTERSEKRLEQREPTFNLEVENDELTDKQRLFCIYYVKCFNATQAAIKSGYSPDTAHVQGSRLLSNVKVSEEIKRLKSNMANALFIDAMDVLNKYVAIAFADLTDYVDFGQEDVPLFTKRGTPILKEDGSQMTSKQTFVAFKNANEVDGTIISELKEGKELSIKLHDKMKALEVLTRYFDLLPDNHKRMVEEQKLKPGQERLELDKQKAAGEGDMDEELIDDWVEAVMDDGSSSGDEAGDQ
jgi:phage terminase small subunit